MMKTLLLTSSALTLAVSLTAAQAQSTAPATQASPALNTSRATTGAQTPLPPTRQIGRPVVEAPPASPERVSSGIPLSAYQRLRVSQILASERGMATSVPFPLTAGTKIPKVVHLEALPPEAVAVVREYSGKSFFVTPDAAVIVNPRTREIVSSFSFADQETALLPAPPAAVTQQVVTLSPMERDAIRREVAPGSTTTPSSMVRPRVASVGDVVPGSVTLEEFPQSVANSVPQLKTYRYYRVDQEVIVVDPDKRRVVDVIQ